MKVCARSNTLQRDALTMVEEDEDGDGDGDGEAARDRDGGGDTVTAVNDMVTPHGVCCVSSDDDGADAAQSATAAPAAPTHVHLRTPAGAGKAHSSSPSTAPSPCSRGQSHSWRVDRRERGHQRGRRRPRPLSLSRAMRRSASSRRAGSRGARRAAPRSGGCSQGAMCSLGHGPRRVALRGARRVALKPLCGDDGGGGEESTTAAAARAVSTASSVHTLVIVANRNVTERTAAEARVTPRVTRRMLLSDISQATVRAAGGGGGGGHCEERIEANDAGDDTPRGGGDGGDDGVNPDDPYPPGLKEVRLTGGRALLGADRRWRDGLPARRSVRRRAASLSTVTRARVQIPDVRATAPPPARCHSCARATSPRRPLLSTHAYDGTPLPS